MKDYVAARQQGPQVSTDFSVLKRKSYIIFPCDSSELLD